jgi:oligopeptide transport system ATP-binding protein
MENKLLSIKNLSVTYDVIQRKSKSFFSKKIPLHAINNLSLDLNQGEILGVVGESGCGKSTLGKAILKLLDSNAHVSGDILFEGVNLLKLNNTQLKKARKMMQIIFQDPLASLNPKMLIKDIIAEPLKVFYPELSDKEITERVYNIMDKVGLAKNTSNRYPHEFSGGQCQRIGIARAMILKPKLLICDEAVSALDVSIKAQIINLLKDLKQEYNMSIIFISHDLSVVKYISDKIAVFYLGFLVEYNNTEDLYNNPRHPYTKALISSIPNSSLLDRVILSGDIPSPLDIYSTCSFYSRCSYAKNDCRDRTLELKKNGDSWVNCLYPLK